ncbi:MAG: phosphoenolpyruvate synthase [Flavobacteriales bacterium]|nr:hypothetical protein [Flavobacteriales bacterium]MCB9449002.1 phosphoenolpyruvate synthase [Flavobacteriales bacterium]
MDADASGVAFGVNPVTGNRREKVVSAVYGLGEGLVSGALNADSFVLTGQGIQSNVVAKDRAMMQDHVNGGTVWVDVDEKRREKPSLNDAILRELNTILHQLEKKCGGPQDVEFAVKNDVLYLLQARPVSAVSKEEYTVWDNSNIVESYPGVTTPLTYSFITKMYEAVYRQFVHLLGVPMTTIDKHAHVFANTLGLVRGRVYYNLLSWYKMLAMVPGYSVNAAYMETMMGVKQRFELREDYRMGKQQAWFRIGLMVVKMIRLQMLLPVHRRRFLKHLDHTMQTYLQMNLSAMTLPELKKAYLGFEHTLVTKWKAPLTNDFFAMIWFGILQKLTRSYGISGNPNIHNDLLCGSHDIISTEPIHMAVAIADDIRAKPDAISWFGATSAKEIWDGLQSGRYPEILRAFETYIQKFGDRCVGELKLETVSYTQDPSRLVQVVQSYLANGISGASMRKHTDPELRSRAEDQMNKALSGHPVRKWWFGFVLKRARDLVSNRENLRFERTRGFGMVRRIMHAIGSRMTELDMLASPSDVFYLSLDQVLEACDDPKKKNLKDIISEAKEAFDAYKRQPPPAERFHSYGNDFSDRNIYSEEEEGAAEGDLQGTGCCPGVVKGRVRVVAGPDETHSLNGDILVTSNTDPGWVTLFPTASAILVERGSLLSHSAIVSREMGIPCIVGITGLLRALSTGDVVEMNGREGTVRIISKHGETTA